MKRILLLICIVLFAGNSLYAQGIRFETASFEEALEKAKVENRLLFVDVYTSWCGPCKRMSREVFTGESVGQYYNEHFVNYKQDAEQGIGIKIKERYGVDAYPTFLFLDGDGKLIYKMVGYHDVKSFLSETKKISFYVRHGGWEQVEADFRSGGGESAFWKDFYEIADDELKHDVLGKYLSSMSDEELFRAESGLLVQKLDYNRELYTRVARGLAKMTKQNIEFTMVYTYPFEEKVSAYLHQSIEEGNEVWFNELLALKKVLDNLPRTGYNDMEVVMNKYSRVSEDFLYLCFYRKNMNKEEAFRALVVKYMDRLIISNPLDSIQKQREERAEEIPMIAQDSLLMKIISEQLKDLVSPEAQALAALWEFRVIANAIVDWTNYYWLIAPSDKEVRERCIRWLNYACAINPCNPEAPVNAATLLVHLGRKKDAIARLEESASLQQKVKNKDSRQIRQLELTLQAVKAGKY